MINLNNYITEKLKINKKSAVNDIYPDEIESIDDIEKYVKALKYKYNIWRYTNAIHLTIYYNKNLYQRIDFNVNDKTFKQIYYDNLHSIRLTETSSIKISSKEVDWEKVIVPEKYIESLRNLRKNKYNKTAVNKMYELADEIEELL